MANKNVKVEMKCPSCGRIFEAQVERKVLYMKDAKGRGNLDYLTFAFNEKDNMKEYINCEHCNKTLYIKSVKNLTLQKGIEFCKKCGSIINPLVANNDKLCEGCD